MPSSSINLIWNGGEALSNPEHPTDAIQALEAPAADTKRTSMYVELFEIMIKTVLLHEQHLFADHEIGLFKSYDKFSYEARFLLVRLSLRKAGKWFRIGENDMDYISELGQNIPRAMDELCANARVRLDKERQIKISQEELLRPIPEVIDLISDDEDQACDSRVKLEEVNVGNEPPEAGPSTLEDDALTIWAEPEESASISELLHCLSKIELQSLAKSMKVASIGKRGDLIQCLMNSASIQTTLPFSAVSAKPKSKRKSPLKQTRLSFAPQGQNQLNRLRQLVMKSLQKCIRINPEVVEIFRRLHLVYYRCTQYSLDFLRPSILARSKKRSYVEYQYQRTSNIWPSREALLDYEEALIKEFEIDEILAGNNFVSVYDRDGSIASRTPAPLDDRLSIVSTTETPGKELQNRRIREAKLIKDKFESVYQRWKDLPSKSDLGCARTKGLERFECGHVLTRIVCKGSNALGILKEYDYELDVLESLLSQTRWRKGRRGGWHDRRALILMTHLSKNQESLQAAKAAVEEGLDDPHTHSKWRPKLQRRLVTLEKKLNVPLEERHIAQGELAKASKITIVGERVYIKADVHVLDNMGRSISKAPQQPSQSLATQYFSTVFNDPQGGKRVEGKPTGKSIWKGTDGEEMSVEAFALKHYESLGYKGFHSEGRIVYTIFGLLFWDIIFAPIPGAFETPYQTAPLDIADDTFYASRQDIIEDRLSEIRDVKQTREILEAVDKKYRESGTWCVGVRWDLCEREDILDIVDCLGGPPLSDICRTISEDYSARASGLPDLIVWDTTKTENRCMFVEVKGPGDSLQENQKVWLDLLIRANIPVEVCHVTEAKTETEKARRSKRKQTKKSRKRSHEDSVEDSEEEPASEEEELTDMLNQGIGKQPRSLSQNHTTMRKRQKLYPSVL